MHLYTSGEKLEVQINWTSFPYLTEVSIPNERSFWIGSNQMMEMKLAK